MGINQTPYNKMRDKALKTKAKADSNYRKFLLAKAKGNINTAKKYFVSSQEGYMQAKQEHEEAKRLRRDSLNSKPVAKKPKAKNPVAKKKPVVKKKSLSKKKPKAKKPVAKKKSVVRKKPVAKKKPMTKKKPVKKTR